MSAPLQNVTHACFGLSYLVALGCEVAGVRWPGRGVRITGLLFGAAGLVAHTAFLIYHHPTPSAPYGALLAIAWVLAGFYLYGTVHHAKQAWAVFVLPVVLGLVSLAVLFDPGATADPTAIAWLDGDRVWAMAHGLMLLFAAIGLSVAFLASLMYLLQARRLKAKASPLGGLKILSLERLEAMNRRAVNTAFPLLTCGLLLGAILLKHYHGLAENWFSVKILGTLGLWGVCLLLCYLRYARHVPGRRLALLSIAAFGLLMAVLLATHPFAGEAVR